MENVTWRKYDLNELREACSKSECWTDVAKFLGISMNARTMRPLRDRVRTYNIDVSHFLSRRELATRTKYTMSDKRSRDIEAKELDKVEKIKNLVPRCTSWSELVVKLGYVPSTFHFKKCQTLCERHNIDVNHFVRNKGNGMPRKWTHETFFVKDCPATRSSNRSIAIRLGFLPTHCFECNIKGEYNGKPITLELDHIDGIWNNNSRDSLRWLCPNCHSQTKTYRNRKRNV